VRSGSKALTGMGLPPHMSLEMGIEIPGSEGTVWWNWRDIDLSWEIGLEHIFKSRFGTLHIVLVDLVPCTPSKLCFAWGTPS
jgi:hypothetical protein